MDGSAKLKAWRKSREITLTKAAQSVAVSHSLWSEWENGTRKPTYEGALKIEKLSEGEVPLESWGYDAAAAVDVARQRATNEAAS